MAFDLSTPLTPRMEANNSKHEQMSGTLTLDGSVSGRVTTDFSFLVEVPQIVRYSAESHTANINVKFSGKALVLTQYNCTTGSQVYYYTIKGKIAN